MRNPKQDKQDVRIARAKEIAIQTAIIGAGVVLCALAKAHAQPPSNNFCQQNQIYRSSPDAMNACMRGLNAAQAVLDRSVRPHGEMDGFRAGFADGLRDGVQRFANDPATKANGANSISADAAIPNLIASHVADLNSNVQGSASNDGSSVVRNRFVSFVESGASKAGGLPDASLPNPLPIPQHSCGLSNPYASLIGPVLSLDDLIAQERFQADDQGFMSQYDARYAGQRPQWGMRDLYGNNYGSHPENFNNIDQAFAQWVNGPGKDEYDSIPAPQAHPAAPVANGNQPGPQAPGHPQSNGPGARPAPVATNPAVDGLNPRQIYADTFKQIYGLKVANTYTEGYRRIYDFSRLRGQRAGQDAGQQYAYQTGRQAQFNDLFKTADAKAFTADYSVGFQAGFRTTYGLYQTSAQPQFQFVKMIDSQGYNMMDEQGRNRVQPGDQARFLLKVTNYGAKGSSYTATLTPVDPAVATVSQTLTISAPALSTQIYTSPLIATFNANDASGSIAQMVLNVGGAQLPLIEQPLIYQVTPQAALQVQSVSIPNGTVTFAVIVNNNSDAVAYAMANVMASDSVGNKDSKNLGILAANQSSPATFTFSGYDPLALINGRVTIQAQTTLGNLVVGNSNPYTVTTQNLNQDLAQAFDVVAADPNKAAFLASLTARLYDEVLKEAVDDGRTGYSSRTDSVIANLVNVKQSHAQTDAAQANYAQLAQALRPVVDHMKGAFISIFKKYSNNQNYLLNQLTVLSHPNRQ